MAWLRKRMKSASFAVIRNGLWETMFLARKSWRLLVGKEGNPGRLRNLCFVLLLLLLSQAFFSFALALFAPLPRIVPAGLVTPAATDQAPRMTDTGTAALGEKLAGLHLFGQAGSQADMSEAPEASLNLVLNGLMFSTSKARSLAVISENGRQGQEGVYGLGDTVPGDATIAAILADRVILRQSGRLKTLVLADHNEQRKPKATEWGDIDNQPSDLSQKDEAVAR
ncbi:MAG: hypothetical protein A2505_00380 [Deltaproteobacteria bacterium RIFOXYD12_FULL_55_16]|nr:MAG: hypothetical protein A2505_00380 [Deltaproteobacteria bacterium RIFOXYD12_FULL_55_16]